MVGSTFTGEKEIVKYEKWLKGRGRSGTSIFNQKRLVREFFDFVIADREKKGKSITTLEHITWNDFSNWREHLLHVRKNKKSSVVTKMNIIISFYKMKYDTTMKQFWLNVYDRMCKVSKPVNVKETINSHKPLSYQQIQKMIDTAKTSKAPRPQSASNEAHVFIMTLLYTGQRRGIYGLQVQEIKWDIDELHIRTKRGDKKLPLHKDLKACLREHIDNRVYESEFVFKYGWDNSTHRGRVNNGQLAYKIVNFVGELAGIDDVKPHGFRKGIGAYLLKKKVSMKFIQAILGHGDIRTTQALYTEVDLEDVKEEFNKLSFINEEEVSPKTRDLLLRLSVLNDDELEQVIRIAEAL